MVMERPPEWMPEWMVGLRLRFDIFVKRLVASQVEPWNIDQQDPEQKEKLELLYNEMIKDINEADVPENIKVGLDPLPAMVGFLLAAAGGGAVSMILGSLLMPYIQSKLTYPMMKQAQPYRLPPDIVYRLWWKLYKGEGEPKELLDDLLEQGFSPERIESGKEASKVMPTPQDIINFLAHEVFEKDMIDKYGLESEWEDIDKEWALKIGLDEKILKLYWLNHWQHPSLSSVYDMLHRDLIDPGDVAEYYKLVEIPEYWRDKLTELSWDVPNRIEIRMMARYLDLPKSRVEEMLKFAGLKEEFRSDAADFMIIMGLQGYWSTMYRNGWLNSEQLLIEIEAKGVSPAIADKVYKYIVKAEKPERTAKERELTKADITKWVKKDPEERWEQGIDLLVDMGYDADEADIILIGSIKLESSPETYGELKAITAKFRRAVGLEAHELTEAALAAEKVMLEAEARLAHARETEAPQAEILQLEALAEELRTRFTAALAQSQEG